LNANFIALSTSENKRKLRQCLNTAVQIFLIPEQMVSNTDTRTLAEKLTVFLVFINSVTDLCFWRWSCIGS